MSAGRSRNGGGWGGAAARRGEVAVQDPPLAPGTQLMHRPRDELFPDAAFTLDKHRERSGGGANDRLADAGHRLADTEQLGNRGGGPGFLAAGGNQRVHARRGDDGDEIEQFGGIGWGPPVHRAPAPGAPGG